MSALHLNHPWHETRGPSMPGQPANQPGDQIRGPSMPGQPANQPGDQTRGPSMPGQPGDRSGDQPGDQIREPSMPGQSRSQRDDQIRGFFDVFARSSNALDLDTLAECFDETFLASDATGTRVVPRLAFLQALAGRAQMFADAGVGRAGLRQLTHQELDQHHVLARTTWAAPRTDGSGEVTLVSSFLLRRDGDRLRIVVYINHQGLPS